MAYTSYTASNGQTINNYGYLNQIWNYLTSRGIPDDGAAALMGNLYAESFCVPYIVQGNTSYPFSYSVNYTNNVNNGTISEHDFVYNGPNGGGYGLAQWTWKTRKQGLYDKWVSGGYSSIGDISLALDYLWYELATSYYTTLTTLKRTDKTMKAKTRYVLFNFENPANKSDSVVNYRYALAFAIYEWMTGTVVVDPPDDESGTGGGNGGGHSKPHSITMRQVLRNPALYIPRRFI